LKTKRIVITGGPGSGKTTLIQHIASQRIPCMPEISREITLKAQQQGVDQLFLEDPIIFSKKLLEGRLAQFMEGFASPPPYLFFDRGMPDVTAYMDYIKSDYPKEFAQLCLSNKYDHIFLLPPWKDIYSQDNERYESFEQAELIHDYLQKSYQKYDYTVHGVPFGSVEQRSDYIFAKLKELS
jgi:predicted ATPase